MKPNRGLKTCSCVRFILVHNTSSGETSYCDMIKKTCMSRVYLKVVLLFNAQHVSDLITIHYE